MSSKKTFLSAFCKALVLWECAPAISKDGHLYNTTLIFTVLSPKPTSSLFAALWE
jgi:hypothetical protein